MKYNLGWGNAVCVRHAFLGELPNKTVFFPLNDTNLSYTPHEGDPQLIEITRKVIERQVGPTYKHIFLTNGAAGGVTLALRAYAKMGYREAITRKPPYFPIYPAMIDSAGLKHLTDLNAQVDLPVILLDSPSNPIGEVIENASISSPIIHDAVYHSKVYTYGNYKPLFCDVIVGSYSKLLGLNGIRTGWVATNDDLVAHRLHDLVTAEYCGLSSASNVVLLNVLKMYRSKTFWENFETRARTNLDYNREEIAKLEKYFQGAAVPRNGMFYYAPMDSACKKLMEKSEMIWTSGSSLGATDDFGRFNVGQDCKLIRDAVKTILRNDKIK